MGVLEFWSLTPRETYQAIEAAAERDQRIHEQLAWTAWHTAALQRTKRMPSWKQFYHRPAKKMTPAELAQRRQDHEAMAEVWRKKQDE